MQGIDFELYKGEVHALIGENGAGKSTLLKILFGIYHPTSGMIKIENEEVHLKNPVDAIRHGIAMIHQEPSVFEDLSIAENIFTGHMRQPVVQWNKIIFRNR